MSELKLELRMAFQKAGWTEEAVDLPRRVDYFAGLFSGSFAICAVAISESSSQVIGCWADLQGALAELRSDGHLSKSKDLYLLFVVDAVDEGTLGDLQNVLDDTRVCRKICLERSNRTLSETLADVPFFLTPGLTLPDAGESANLFAVSSGLPEPVQHDLERRSAQVILDRLVDGEYDVK